MYSSLTSLARFLLKKNIEANIHHSEFLGMEQ